MKIRDVWVTAFALLLISCGPSSVSPPSRPAHVPKAATWAGGLDGGNWFLCSPRSESPTRFSCAVYNDFTGELMAQGQFELRQDDSTEGTRRLTIPAVIPSSLGFGFFDGNTIHLDGPYLLLPDGEIHFPFGPGWGKRQKFKLGEELGPEVEYGTRSR